MIAHRLRGFFVALALRQIEQMKVLLCSVVLVGFDGARGYADWVFGLPVVCPETGKTR